MTQSDAPDRPRPRSATHRDDGSTLIETLFVVLILGILAAAAVLSISGMRADAVSAGCEGDERVLAVATEAYFAQQRTDAIPASSPDARDPDRFERTLVTAGLLRSPSATHDLDAAGVITRREGSAC